MESEYLLQRRAKMLGLAKPEPEKKPAKIKPMAKKREVKQREYRKLVKQMLEEDKHCAIHSPVCTHVAQGLHHKVKRSMKNLTDLKILVRSCNACNSFLEENPDWGVEHGFIISKFKP